MQTTQYKIRVLLAAPSGGYLGGQAIQAARMAEAFARDGRLAVTFQPHDPSLGPLRFLAEVKLLRTLVREAVYLAQLLWRVPRADVVHVFSASYWSFVLAPAPAVLLGRLFRRPVLLNYRSGEALDHLTRWPRTTRPVLGAASAIVVSSGYLVDVFARFGFHAEAVPNVIDLGRFRWRARDPLRPVFLSNRNFEPHYDVANTLRAFALIAAAVPGATLAVAGDGPQRAELEQLAATLGLSGVRFLGPVANVRMPEVYDAADIYLNSSRIDNMPGSLIEAFAAGLPVVSSDAGGIPHMVENGRTGLLVAPADPVAMAAAARRLLDDAELARNLSVAAREEAQSYTWERVGPQWEALYARLVRLKTT
jgi:L-malate glycosyltransferase